MAYTGRKGFWFSDNGVMNGPYSSGLAAAKAGARRSLLRGSRSGTRNIKVYVPAAGPPGSGGREAWREYKTYPVTVSSGD